MASEFKWFLRLFVIPLMHPIRWEGNGEQPDKRMLDEEERLGQCISFECKKKLMETTRTVTEETIAM